MSFQQQGSQQQQTFPGFANALSFNTSAFEQYSHANMPSNVQFPSAPAQNWSGSSAPAQTLSNWSNQNSQFAAPGAPAQSLSSWTQQNSQFSAPAAQLPAQTMSNWASQASPAAGQSFSFSSPAQNSFNFASQLPAQNSFQNDDLSQKWNAATQASSSAANQFQSYGQSSFPSNAQTASAAQLPAQTMSNWAAQAGQNQFSTGQFNY